MVVSFAEITEIVAQHQRAEAARTAPAEVACNALDTLRDALTMLAPSEWSEIRDELYALIREMDATAWERFSVALTTREA